MKKPKVVAEIGCNHLGDIKIAKRMILTAKVYCKVDVVKFQKRTPRALLSEIEYNNPHPNPINSYGKTYGEHREFLEFNLDQHYELKEYCDSLDLIYSSSVWDVQSAMDIISLNPKFIKVPSACNLNKNLLKVLCEKYIGKIHISFGMTSKSEEKDILDFFIQHHRCDDLIIYSCTAGYPVPFEDVCLNEISRLRKTYSEKVNSIGFSGHHLGIAIDLGAFMLGAEWIERHFTLDRTWKGTDHAASLEPEGFRKLVRDLEALSKSLKFKNAEILEIEKVQREKLKKSQIVWGK